MGSPIPTRNCCGRRTTGSTCSGAAPTGAPITRRAVSARWSRARKLIVEPGQRPYVKVDSDGKDTIALRSPTGIHGSAPRASTTRPTATGGSGTPRAPDHRLARAPITPRQADLVYDGKRPPPPAGSGMSRSTTGAAGDRLRDVPSTRNHAYWYARWNGQRWVSHFMTFAGPSISPGTIEQQYSGGMAPITPIPRSCTSPAGWGAGSDRALGHLTGAHWPT